MICDNDINRNDKLIETEAQNRKEKSEWIIPFLFAFKFWDKKNFKSNIKVLLLQLSQLVGAK